MQNKTLRFAQITVAVCVFLVLLIFPLEALAQSGFFLFLHQPDLVDFPKITLFVDAYDPQGQFIPSMDLNSFNVREDGIDRVVNEVKLLEPGLHTIVAMNLGPTLSNRPDTVTPTRFEEAVFAVANWLNKLDVDAQDQFSLISSEGVLAENLQDKADFTYKLQNYKPNLFNFQPNFTSLSLALDTAEKPSLIPQSKQAILFITPLPLDQSLEELSALQSRAAAIRVPVHIWLMAPETASNAPSLDILRQLSSATGGTFLHYYEGTPLPDPEQFINRLRNVYRLRYTSEISRSGSHSLVVTGIYGNQEERSNEISLNIDLNLPTIFLKNLSSTINRRYEDVAGGRKLLPDVITVASEVIFPDGFDRQLKATRFYVDGELIVENTAPPYEFFGWPLGVYQFSGEHLVSAEVEDILGFRSISPPITVMIYVESPYPAWLTAALQFFLKGGWIIAAVLALGGTAFLGVRLRRRLAAGAQGTNEAQDGYIDPLDQTVPGLGFGYASVSDAPNVRAEGQFKQPTPPRLIWESGSLQPMKKTLQINKQQIIIGSDSDQSDFVLDSPEVSPQHSCLARSDTGAVTIADLGSESGTWVNFAPVSAAGTVLNNGDLVRIGKATFRYYIGNSV